MKTRRRHVRTSSRTRSSTADRRSCIVGVTTAIPTQSQAATLALLGLFVCIGSSTPGAVVERIRAPVAPRSAMQPVGVETVDGTNEVYFVGDASSSESFEPYQASSTQSILWYEMEYCNLVTGGATGFDNFRVDFRYRGRSRSMEVPLGYAAMVQATNQCTDDAHDQIQVEHLGWTRQTTQRLDQFGDVEAIKPFGLSPENVSRDLCRYLDGAIPHRDGRGESTNAEFEPLKARAVFRLEDTRLAEGLGQRLDAFGQVRRPGIRSPPN